MVKVGLTFIISVSLPIYNISMATIIETIIKGSSTPQGGIKKNTPQGGTIKSLRLTLLLFFQCALFLWMKLPVELVQIEKGLRHVT
jgi:hypothetical protein